MKILTIRKRFEAFKCHSKGISRIGIQIPTIQKGIRIQIPTIRKGIRIQIPTIRKGFEEFECKF